MEILHILETYVATFVENRKKNSLGNFPDNVYIQTEAIREYEFDIHDCKNDGFIRCSRTAPDRAATYLNGEIESPNNLLFIKYEEFLNQFRLDASHDWAKGLSRVDYIVIIPDSMKYFILHEVSIGNIRSKQSDAKNQFIGTLRFLWSIPEMRQYIEKCTNKICFVSALGCNDIKSSPRGVATGFFRPYAIVPNPSEFKVPSINKLGFTVWKGNIVRVD